MADRRRALLVATSVYQDPAFGQLESPAADVAALSDVLKHPVIGGYEVELLSDATSYQVNQAIERFYASAGVDDSVLLYFSGHGYRAPGNRLYMVTHDSQMVTHDSHPDLLGSTAVSAQFVRERIEACRSRRKILILDCCYAGAFPAGTKGGQEVDVIGEFNGRGNVVITASSAIQYALAASDPAPAEVDGKVKPSVFTGVLVEGITTGSADLNGDGVIDIDELYRYVHDQVRLKVPGQTPQKKGEVEGTLLIARSPLGARPAQLPSEILDALRSPLSRVRLSVITDLLDACSNASPSMLLAVRLALRDLINDDSRSVAKAAREALVQSGEPVQEQADPGELLAGAQLEADEITSAARDEATRIRAEIEQAQDGARARAQQIISDAQHQADDITAAAGDKAAQIQIEIRQAQDKAEAEADRITTRARQEADAIIATATDEATRIRTEAQQAHDDVMTRAQQIIAAAEEQAGQVAARAGLAATVSSSPATNVPRLSGRHRSQPSQVADTPDSTTYVTPLVQRLAADLGVDLSAIEGTGIGGRVRKQDVLAAAEAKAPEKTAVASDEDWWTEDRAVPPAAEAKAPVKTAVASDEDWWTEDRAVPPAAEAKAPVKTAVASDEDWWTE